MQGTSTIGKFGTLKAVMRNAYILTHDAIGTADSDATAAGDN